MWEIEGLAPMTKRQTRVTPLTRYVKDRLFCEQWRFSFGHCASCALGGDMCEQTQWEALLCEHV